MKIMKIRLKDGSFVSIPLGKGADGYTPKKGIDYYTDEEEAKFLMKIEETVVGYAKGYKTGYDEGNDAGYKEGHDAGHTAGHDEGYNEGKADGYREGYDAGHTAGHDEGYNDGKTSGYAEGLADGIESGKTTGRVEEKKRYWNANQKNGTETYYTYHYAGNGWTDETYDPQHPIKATANANYMFCGSWITDTKVPITLGANNRNYKLFFDAGKLVTIRKLIVNKDTELDSSSFQDCTKLQNLTIEGEIGNSIDLHWSTSLSKASVRSLVEHLSKSTSGLTLTLNSYAKTRFTTTEWNTLVNSKKNWTISLRS